MTRPPLRRCPACGGDHYSWQEHEPCSRCRVDLAVQEGRAELARLAREHRERMRQEALEALEWFEVAPQVSVLAETREAAESLYADWRRHPVETDYVRASWQVAAPIKPAPVPYGEFPPGF